MKLTKTKLKQLIKEELSAISEFEEPELKSGVGKALAQKIASASGVEMLLAQLKEKDLAQKAEFIAYFAQLLGVNLSGKDISVTTSAQTRMQKQAAAEASSTAPPEEEV